MTTTTTTTITTSAMETPHTPTPTTTTTTSDSTPAPKRKSCGRRLNPDGRSTADANGCVIHHIRIHESLDAIIRAIVTENKMTFRQASESALIMFANAHGYKIDLVTKEVVTTKRVTEYKVGD